MTESTDAAYTVAPEYMEVCGMTGLWFFLLVFCGIFGAYALAGIVYDTFIKLLKGLTRNARNDRRASDYNRHGGGNSL